MFVYFKAPEKQLTYFTVMIICTQKHTLRVPLPLTSTKDGGCLMARIQVSNDPSGRVIVSFPYDPLLVEKVKTIDGRRWHPAEKHWSFPKADGMVEKILKVFRDKEVQIDPGLQAKFPALKGTVPDLKTDNHSIPPLEKGGEGGFANAGR
ncbi:MAG: hypothetical protein COZ69_13980 [Deltaproteobacteria bacterium CG_4_8_14_3_um_filter_45_9]|nr:MAG: hypothetical protein COS40_04850 [Deltaproteobacteria bacterium CG03_land_8_20_14_0_80_45_14]PIX21591.1 MAG: hypothetical protein COZ69_13980 [Deltaproteobacteria bacterium CG_4_8_14_3_um_filter_45_9]